MATAEKDPETIIREFLASWPERSVDRFLDYFTDDAVVVGTPDDRFGERVTAVVQPRAGTQPSAEELVAFAAQHLARYKLPKTTVLVDEMVRSPSGKPDYRWARARALEARGLPVG